MLYLASKSPRRRQLLEQMGVRFECVDVDVVEVRAADESPREYVVRVAREKAVAGLLQLSCIADAVVLGADTEVVLNDAVFGKPADAADAATMLQKLAGRTHQVLSAVCCMNGTHAASTLRETHVSFAALSARDIAAYIDHGEWQGKAGAYAIQGRAGAWVSHLSGSYSGVMGLPLHETLTLLRGLRVA